jgi:hypothetical protein
MIRLFIIPEKNRSKVMKPVDLNAYDFESGEILTRNAQRDISASQRAGMNYPAERQAFKTIQRTFSKDQIAAASEYSF